MDPIIPKPKPFTEEQFKLNTDRRIKGALGGFDRGEMVDLIQKDLRKIEESGTMDYNDALKFIKERTQELKEFLENNPGKEMPTLPGFEEEERVNFLDGGDTEYNSMVTKKYIELGGQEGTGMDIDKFAEEYFPKMADGGRIGFAEGPPGLTKRQRTKAKYLESIPGYLDNETFAALRMENSDMTNNQFAEFLNDNGYKPDTRQADKFKGGTIDRRYNVAVENGLIPKDFVFAGSAADRAITEADVEEYKKFFLEKNKNNPKKIKKFNKLTFKQLKGRVSDQRKYEKAKQDPEFLTKKAEKGKEYRARIKAEGGEAYEKYLETAAGLNREKRSNRNVFYRNNRDGKSMLWEDLLKRNEEGKNKFFEYEKPLPKKEGGYYDKATTQNVVLIDSKGNKYRFDTLYEDINKAGYSAENAAKPYNQKAFLYGEGLMPELNRLSGIEGGQRRNPFHVHHVSGVKKNPFDVMLTFEGANINEGNQRGGLTTTFNKILEKEKAAPGEASRYNEKKAALQKFYSSLDPDIAVKLGKKEKGNRPKLIDMLDKTGIKLTDDQRKRANQLFYKPLDILKEKYRGIRPGIEKATNIIPGKADNAIAAAIDFPMMYMTGSPFLEAAGSAASMFMKDPTGAIGKTVNPTLALTDMQRNEMDFVKDLNVKRSGLESMLESLPSRFKESIQRSKGIKDETEEYIP